MTKVLALCRAAKKASATLARSSRQERDRALQTIAQDLLVEQQHVLAQNAVDREAALAQGLAAALVERLTLTPHRIQSMVASLQQLAELPDPLGEQFDANTLPNGLQVHKQRVPLGVLAVIYESRPNVTIDVAALALKSGNAVILRGGKETLRTNAALVAIIKRALQKTGIPTDVIQFIQDPDRRLVQELFQMYEYVDMLIPRGGAGLHRYCRENSLIPVITGGIGICHLFVDESVDLAKSLEVIVNAKVQRPTVCNALDTVLLHHNVVAQFIPMLLKRMAQEEVTVFAEQRLFHEFTQQYPYLQMAGVEDFDREWLSLQMGVAAVADLSAAIAFIKEHSTGHSDGILTNNASNAAAFLNEIDSSAVYVNASTRFTDGGELGLGAEVAISTQRLHARGPMGLNELTTYKWVIQGDYQTRV